MRIQADGAVFFGAPYFCAKEIDGKWNTSHIGNGMSLRRTRFAIKAQLDKNWYGELDTDWTSGTPELKDAYLAFTGVEGLEIKAGNFKENFSIQRNTTSHYLGFNARYPDKWFWASAGVFGPELSSSGFSAKKSVIVELFTPEGKKIDTFQRGEKGSAWGDQGLEDNKGSWSRIPDGTGEWAYAVPTPGEAHKRMARLSVPVPEKVWERESDEIYIISRTALENEVFPAFMVDMPALDKDDTICEVGNVLINGAKVITINSESTEIEDIKKAIADCGLEGVENINYLQAIKRVIGMSDKPLANE